MHKEFAEIYDIFMKYVNYDEWYKFLRTFIKKKGTVLDLGCGTGEFIWRFLKDGFSVIGVDLSEKMLEISEKKLNIFQHVINHRRGKTHDGVETPIYFLNFCHSQPFLYSVASCFVHRLEFINIKIYLLL